MERIKPRVMIHPASYGNVRRAVDRAFELFSPDLRGKKVLVKPNVLRASEAAEGIVTHPAVLRAVVEKVEAMAPASLVVGDNPGVFCYGENERSFEKTGLREAAKGYYRNIGNEAQEIDFNPDFLARVAVSRAVLDADIIISLPKFKTHGLTVITGAIKNSFGFLPGAQKGRLHRAAGSAERFHEAIVEVFRLRAADLFLVDAVVGMEGNGPAGSDLREIGLILASDNAVAVDTVMAAMVGLDPMALPFLRHAKRLGLGDPDLGALEIVGEFRRLAAFKLPPLTGTLVLADEQMQAVLRERLESRPRADRDLCTGCGTCIDQCPVSALSMIENVPQVDGDTCITCFCCQEICPEKAIALAS
jgi:uncharacterized protein (DUF362 family)/Pyruvate/2-oxoacid:ferredoxin oxidoreductase delta subunit